MVHCDCILRMTDDSSDGSVTPSFEVNEEERVKRLRVEVVKERRKLEIERLDMKNEKEVREKERRKLEVERLNMKKEKEVREKENSKRDQEMVISLCACNCVGS